MDGGYGRPIDDAERQAVIASLRQRAERGQIDEDEMESRVSRARTAMTRAGLDSLLMDLAPDAASEPRSSSESSPSSPAPWADLEAGGSPTTGPPPPAAPPPPTIAGPIASGFPTPPGSIDRVTAGAEMMRVSHLAPMLIALVVVALVGMSVVLIAGRGGQDPDGPSIAVDEPLEDESATTIVGPTVVDPPDGADSTTIPTIPAPTTPGTSPAPPPVDTAPGFPDFTEHRLRVGTDIAPGRYVNTETMICYWERIGGDGEVIVNGNGGRVILEVRASDAEMVHSGCGEWRPYAPPPEPATSLGTGDWFVGADVVPGTYRSDLPAGGGGTDLCAWERATGFTHDFDEVIQFEYPAPREVTLRDGERFTSYDCGTWTKV